MVIPLQVGTYIHDANRSRKSSSTIRRFISLSILSTLFLFVTDLWAQNFVVVKSKSKFFQTASSTSPFLRSKKESGFLTLELIEQKAKRVLVKIERNRSCYSAVRTVGFELHLWVNRTDLEKVTLESLNWEFKDGSQVQVASGMVVKRGKIITRHGSLPLKIPRDKIGFSFRQVFLPVRTSTTTWHSTHDSLSAVREKPLSNVLRSKRGMRFNSGKYFRQKMFRNVEKIGGLDEVKNKCIRVRGTLQNPKKFKGDIYNGLGTGAKLGGKKRRVPVMLGILFTPKGEKIGKTKQGLSFGGKLKETADLLCKEFNIFSSTKTHLCVKRTKVVRFKSGLPGVLFVFELNKITSKGTDLVEVKRVLGRKRNAIKYCYTKQIFNGKIEAGSLSITGKVGIDGRMRTATIAKSTLNSIVAKNCVLKIVKRFRFKKSKDQSLINFRISFSLEET